MNALVYVDIDQGIHKGKNESCSKWKTKKTTWVFFLYKYRKFWSFSSEFKLERKTLILEVCFRRYLTVVLLIMQRKFWRQGLMTGHTHLNPSKKELYVVCEGADVLNHHFLLVLVIVERSQFTFFVLRILEENKRASSLKRNTKDYSWQNQIRIRCLNIDTPAVDDIIFNELLNLITQLCLPLHIVVLHTILEFWI